jgi:hypothetical protein
MAKKKSSKKKKKKQSDDVYVYLRTKGSNAVLDKRKVTGMNPRQVEAAMVELMQSQTIFTPSYVDDTEAFELLGMGDVKRREDGPQIIRPK